MNVQVLKANLSSRDANLMELRNGKITQVPLSSILPSSTSSEILDGDYQSIQGPTITPMPLWSIEVKTFKRNVGGEVQESPWISDELFGVKTSRSGQKVRGTGSEKEKWRSVCMDAPIEGKYIFTVATSTWLIPFAIGHRSLACLPVSIENDGIESLHVHHELAQSSGGTLLDFPGEEGGPSNAIRNWTKTCQKIWKKLKKEAGVDLVTKRLDYNSNLSRIRPSTYKVIHTRSRLFYAGLLNPTGETALGLPFERLRLNTRINGKTKNSTEHEIGGVIVDNKVHYIEVASEAEGHWMVALFNSKPFSDKVMDTATGEPPNIYSIPAKILIEQGINYNPASTTHQKLARLGRQMARKMSENVKEYYIVQKELDIHNIGDSEASIEVPPLIMGKRFRDYLSNLPEWVESNEIAKDIMKL